MNFTKEYIRKKSLGYLSSAVHNAIKKELQVQLNVAGINLKVDLFPIVNKLFETDEVSQQTIADWFSCDRHRMSRTLDELENAGFIERKNDPNSRRTNLICLSAYAKQNQNTIEKCILKVFNKAYTDFSEEETQKTIQSLEKILKNLG